MTPYSPTGLVSDLFGPSNITSSVSPMSQPTDSNLTTSGFGKSDSRRQPGIGCALSSHSMRTGLEPVKGMSGHPSCRDIRRRAEDVGPQSCACNSGGTFYVRAPLRWNFTVKLFQPVRDRLLGAAPSCRVRKSAV